MDLETQILAFFDTSPLHHTSPNSEIICGQNVGTKVVCGMILFFERKATLSIITGRLQAWLQVKTLHFSYTGTLLKFYRQVL